MLLPTFCILIIAVIKMAPTHGSIIKPQIINAYSHQSDYCSLPPNLVNEIQGYQSVVNQIINKILKNEMGKTWNKLSEFIDKFGSRLSGTENLENAIDYMVKEFTDDGFENVHTEEAYIPHWERGYESAVLIEPRNQSLPILGLGTSVGTPSGGLTADVLVVENFTEFDGLSADLVRGKIVVFVPKWVSYGVTVEYRGRSASVAARKGAVAALVRSITPFSIATLHTGMQRYDSDVKQIPVASVTVEDAEMLLRMYRRGEKIRIHMEMGAKTYAPKISRNTIGEFEGKVFKNESVVVLSGHLDSWDVGTGAMDDGGGAFISWRAIQSLIDMGLRPRRTLRAILWTGEEFGYVGARAYEKQHRLNADREFNMLIESDIGTFEPEGLDFSGSDSAGCILKEILSLMDLLNATRFETPADGGPDISVWPDRFPKASLINKNDNYFWFHHSNGDRMEVEDPSTLDKGTALFAAAAYVIADLSVDMPKY